MYLNATCVPASLPVDASNAHRHRRRCHEVEGNQERVAHALAAQPLRQSVDLGQEAGLILGEGRQRSGPAVTALASSMWGSSK